MTGFSMMAFGSRRSVRGRRRDLEEALVEIQGEEVEDWASAAAGRHGFTSVTHMVEVFGICKACARG